MASHSQWWQIFVFSSGGGGAFCASVGDRKKIAAIRAAMAPSLFMFPPSKFNCPGYKPTDIEDCRDHLRSKLAFRPARRRFRLARHGGSARGRAIESKGSRAHQHAPSHFG